LGEHIVLHQETHFAARDGLRLYEQCWLLDGPSQAAVVIVHGINEHSGRYARLAADLTGRGYAVYMMDLRGHGRSDGDRVMIRSFDEYLDDVEVLLERVAEREPGKALFLLGHSMGGAIVALLAIERPPRIRGLILSSPALRIGGRVFPILRKLAAFFSVVWPTLRVVGIGHRFISHDPAVVAAFENDPLVFHGRLPVRTGAEILRAASRIQTHMEAVRLPLLILHGTGDFITDPNGSRQLYRRANSSDKTLRLYPALYHEVFSEPERDQALADLLGWLDARRESESA
jgi:alpha-beta hydrolase superfamily lysophospholipase